MIKIKTALISVSDKTSLEDVLGVLKKYDVRIISSGGTAERIRELGYDNVLDVSDYTGFPESPGGYVKTLHPKIHAGLLLNRKNPEHAKYMREHGVLPIDLVISNFYPFEKVIYKPNVTYGEVFENIDIGGPALVRSAAKGALINKRVMVVTDPFQYDELIKEMEELDGKISSKTIRKFACEAFTRVRKYDEKIDKGLALYPYGKLRKLLRLLKKKS